MNQLRPAVASFFAVDVSGGKRGSILNQLRLHFAASHRPMRAGGSWRINADRVFLALGWPHACERRRAFLGSAWRTENVHPVDRSIKRRQSICRARQTVLILGKSSGALKISVAYMTSGNEHIPVLTRGYSTLT
jgi:hypothetical protein